MTTKLLLGLCTLIFVCAGCEKDKQDEEQLKEKVYASTLMGTSGKRWSLREITLNYYNAGGELDSTVKLEPNSTNYLYNTLYFTQDGSRKTFDTENLLTNVMPAYGSWQFNEAAQKISFTCIENRFFPCNGTDGEWTITNYLILSYNPLRETLAFERTVTLTGGRKVKQRISLIIV